MRKLPPVASTRSKDPTYRVIEADSDLREGVRALRRKCAVMRRVHDAAGHPPLRRRPGGFEGLARIVVGQQVSVASAEAIWARTVLAVQPFEPDVLLALGDGPLAAAGLSRPKIRTLQAIATSMVAGGGLDLARLDRMPDAEVHAALTAVSGIGPWTADIYLMFCLGRADAWASGDLALQLAAREAFGLDERPDRQAMLELAERWRPWRGVAARLLWAYYAMLKARKKVVPV
jgi:DNA-3-methyladenine glycosylase II